MWQLLRECPPGYGGVERVAHELAEAWQIQGHSSTVFFFAAGARSPAGPDPLPVRYGRVSLPCCGVGRLLLPLPSRRLLRLLTAPEPLHAHLPCPAVLALALIARLLQPRRVISLHWHSFLEAPPITAGCLFAIYQWLAERLLPCFSRIITTSPVLQAELIASGAAPSTVRVLPCSLPESFERQSAPIAAVHLAEVPASGLCLISIGRLDSYKRVDWLIEALAAVRDVAVQLNVLGDGPDRGALEQQATVQAPGRVRFYGRVDEATKLALLARADLLVLAANRCNEAFGIVQLEAMACAVPAVAFEHPRSGMAWVSRNSVLDWDARPASLPFLIAKLAADPKLLARARRAAYERYCNKFARQMWSDRFQEVFAP